MARPRCNTLRRTMIPRIDEKAARRAVPGVSDFDRGRMILFDAMRHLDEIKRAESVA